MAGGHGPGQKSPRLLPAHNSDTAAHTTNTYGDNDEGFVLPSSRSSHSGQSAGWSASPTPSNEEQVVAVAEEASDNHTALPLARDMKSRGSKSSQEGGHRAHRTGRRRESSSRPHSRRRDNTVGAAVGLETRRKGIAAIYDSFSPRR
jgi:hypothetical protein